MGQEQEQLKQDLAPGLDKQLEAVSKELENGNGCAAKLLLDSIPTQKEHQQVFAALAIKHQEMYPDSKQVYETGPAALISVDDGFSQTSLQPQRTDTTITAFESVNKPGLIWGTNVYSGWNFILEDKFDEEKQTRTSTCMDLKKSKDPVTEHGLHLTEFQ